MNCLTERWARAAALAAVCACLASAVHAQPAGATRPAGSSLPFSWMDMSNWLNWWPWSDTTPPPPGGVESPHYGDSLFYFYQGRYFSSVTRLMASQQFGRMVPHDDEAEILRGGLFLSYGMHREAGEVFARLIERGAPPPVRDRAWYYLAKIRYQRGLYAESEDALGRIDKPLAGALEEDRALLQANVLMARGKYTEAIRVLDVLAKGPGATSYVRYNLGVALVRSGDLARGTKLLDEVGKLPATSDEFRSLRDKANVALGFASLQEGRSEPARAYLERVRLSGMYSNKALLGFGWAAAAQGQMKSALVPWSELATRDPGDAAVLEAKLAVPYAFADLGASAQALELYQDAIGVFDRESVNLDKSVAAIRSGKLLDGLMASNPGEEMGWFWSISELPEGQDLPLGGHLALLMATHPFQEAFKNYRDLLYLSRNLQQWQESLGVLRDMLANRREAFAARLPQIQEKERALNLAGFEQRFESLQVELDRVERDGDAAAFATVRERELQARLDRVRETLNLAAKDSGLTHAELAQANERARRAAGALLWQQNDQFAVRLWSAKKGMQELQRNLAQAQQRDAALVAAQRDEPARLDAFAGRLDLLAARVDTMVPRVAVLTQEQQAAVQELAVAELLQQKERLAAYGTQARFAVAQIVDRASLAKESARVPAQ
ncbi:MAG TPA: tetratricopeptide repeat protein [Burkholderiaceae bacterium]|nr:tetratricopeptide repeat protein [Burkholderiaceae bacterium]